MPGAAGAVAGASRGKRGAIVEIDSDRLTAKDADIFEKGLGLGVRKRRYLEFDGLMHHFFSAGRFYRLRLTLSVLLFVVNIVSDLAIAWEYYHQVHTNFSMTIAMSNLAGLMYVIWFQIKPRSFYYKPNAAMKEFVFEPLDLRDTGDISHQSDSSDSDDSDGSDSSVGKEPVPHKAAATLSAGARAMHKLRIIEGVKRSATKSKQKARREQMDRLDRERDDKWYYCTTKRDVQFKVRLDTTLRPLQGLLTYGYIFAGISAAVQMFYIFRYNNCEKLSNPHSVYHLCFGSTLTNFCWSVSLTMDLPYFFEVGGRVLFWISDAFKYLLFISALLISETSSQLTASLSSLIFAPLMVALVAAMDSSVYFLITDIGSAVSFQQRALPFGAFLLLSILFVLVATLTSLPLSFAFLCLCCVPANSQLTRLLVEFVKHGLDNLKSSNGKRFNAKKRMSRKTAFLSNWMISSETGKTRLKQRHRIVDSRHKVLAFNAAVAEATAPNENLIFQRTLHKMAAKSNTFAFAEFKYWLLPTTFTQNRPAFMQHMAHLLHGAELPAPRRGAWHLCFFVTWFSVCVVLRQCLALAAPLSVYFYSGGNWRKEYNVCTVAYYIVTGFALTHWLYYARHAFVYWHLMDPSVAKTKGTFALTDVDSKSEAETGDTFEAKKTWKKQKTEDGTDKAKIGLGEIQAVLEVLTFEYAQEMALVSDNTLKLSSLLGSTVMPENTPASDSQTRSTRTLTTRSRAESMNFITAAQRRWPPADVTTTTQRLTHAVYAADDTLSEIMVMQSAASLRAADLKDGAIVPLKSEVTGDSQHIASRPSGGSLRGEKRTVSYKGTEVNVVFDMDDSDHSSDEDYDY